MKTSNALYILAFTALYFSNINCCGPSFFSPQRRTPTPCPYEGDTPVLFPVAAGGTPMPQFVRMLTAEERAKLLRPAPIGEEWTLIEVEEGE